MNYSLISRTDGLWDAQDILNAFAYFEESVFNHTQFLILDTNLVRPAAGYKSTVIKRGSTSSEYDARLIAVEECTDYETCYYYPETGPQDGAPVRLGMQPGMGGWCLDWTECNTYYYGAGGGFPSNGGNAPTPTNPTPPPSGGGSGPWYSNPCTPPGGSNPCIGLPGWTPVEDYDPNEAKSIIIDTSISKNYPCLSDLLQQMPNANKEAQLLMDSIFGQSTKINLTFAIDRTLGQNNSAAQTLPRSVFQAQQGLATYFSDTIFLNPFYVQNASEEYMVGVIYHEAVHAYINYQFYLYSIGQRDSNYLKLNFPLFWNMANGDFDVTHSLYSEAQHAQMAASYVNTLQNLIAPFYDRNLASQTVKDRVIKSFVWGGLRRTTQWKQLGSDTCQIRADLLAGARVNTSVGYSSANCSLIFQNGYLDLKLNTPCQ